MLRNGPCEDIVKITVWQKQTLYNKGLAETDTCIQVFGGNWCYENRCSVSTTFFRSTKYSRSPISITFSPNMGRNIEIMTVPWKPMFCLHLVSQSMVLGYVCNGLQRLHLLQWFAKWCAHRLVLRFSLTCAETSKSCQCRGIQLFVHI